MTPETHFHETWLGMVQPAEGLVVSIPTLLDAQCMARQPTSTRERLLTHCHLVEERDDPESAAPGVVLHDVEGLFADLLELTPDLFDVGDALPEDLSLWVPEGRQLIRPTRALRKLDGAASSGDGRADTPAGRAGAGYVLLAWEVPTGLDLDRAETVTGDWHYPPAAKFDRLLRHCRVPIGILTNRREIRLVYAPHGESSGWISFRLDDMATAGGRPILDAFVMLLSARRIFGVAREHQLGALLKDSRERQANVTNELAEQVFEAMAILLRGFETAAERDPSGASARRLDDAARSGDDHLYSGLLTVLLRLVFVLYAEHKKLLPVEHPFYAEHLSVLGLFDALQEDHGAHPDTMSRRFGAWGRLVALFRAVYLGASHGDFHMPPRRGELFDPARHPFLEGWSPGGGAPIKDADARATVRLPLVDDGTVFEVLRRLVIFQGQRLSYATLDVEQIGSVYEALMGYHIVRVFSPAVCLRPTRTWVEVSELSAIPASRRGKWLQETAGLAKGAARAVVEAVAEADADADAEAVAEALARFAIKGTERASAGRLVIQPGMERRRTSSHYTPRSLSGPIVERTLEPLLAAMGEEPSSARLLELKICDPAMGSGAFLVEACRRLADRVVAAWTREGRLERVASAHEDVVNHARRLVAQRCLYGVDKNPFAVQLAKLSLWLETLAAELPFTFLDHALRCGDSLVGLDFRQIRGFDWQPEGQETLCSRALVEAMDEALELRRRILELAESDLAEDQREKERLLERAEAAVERVRVFADVIVGAFFSAAKEKERRERLGERMVRVGEWLADGGAAPVEVLQWREEMRERLTPFHWMLEFPEVFHAEREDPLEDGVVNRAAFFDAFVGNPPFLGGRRTSTMHGDEFSDWLDMVNEAGKNADLSAHFFRQADRLLGKHGTLGLIATNTIAQGDTRAAGLQPLIAAGHTIYDATQNMLWPGEAAVAVSVVHTAKGRPQDFGLRLRLDGKEVKAISSRLRPTPERPDPQALLSNRNLSFQGTVVVGIGFTLTSEERAEIIARDARNAERIFPYIGGEEVNTSPTQSHHRYVISFGDMDLSEAEKWPDLIEIVRERVKPDRDHVKREVHRKYWWHFGDKRPALYEAIRKIDCCLVNSQTSKFLIFAFQPTDRIFSHALYAYPFDTHTPFAVLQSRIHEFWARLLSSSLEERLRYTASDCFETFPFPNPDPKTKIPLLESLGKQLDEARSAYMLSTDQGLTKTYNHLKDPHDQDPAVASLRRLHQSLDEAVLTAYGWTDIPVPPYAEPETDAERRALEAFEDEILDRLFQLNAERATEERVLGLEGGGKGGKARKKAKASRSHEGQKGLFD